MKEVLGDAFVERYVTAKRAEWEAYTAQVTEWEIDQYLYKNLMRLYDRVNVL